MLGEDVFSTYSKLEAPLCVREEDICAYKYRLSYCKGVTSLVGQLSQIYMLIRLIAPNQQTRAGGKVYVHIDISQTSPTL